MSVVSPREYLFVIVGSVVLSLVVLPLVFPWLRHLRALITIALTTAIGIVIWNTLLNLTNATSLNVDSPLVGLSAQDVGSGLAAFLVTLLTLRYITPKYHPLAKVLPPSAVVGLLTILVDLLG